MLKRLETLDKNAKVFIPATIDREKDVHDQVVVLQKGQKHPELPPDVLKQGKVFTVGSLHSIPGKYMQGRLGDEDLNTMIKDRLNNWISSKMLQGLLK